VFLHSGSPSACVIFFLNISYGSMYLVSFSFELDYIEHAIRQTYAFDYIVSTFIQKFVWGCQIFRIFCIVFHFKIDSQKVVS
jgi:hypothetical protein